jgi:dihydrofolate synthase/folylpolyglutamate synthase
MIGNYQIENASLAIEAILQLQRFGFTIFEKTIRETLRHLYIPGRFEVKKHMPLIILDGAHNPAKMKAFLASCVKRYKKNKKIFIISITKGHNTSNMLRQISKVADIIIFCQYHIATDMGRKRAEEAIRLKKEYDSILNKKTKQFFLIKNSKESVRKALKKAKENDIIVITGSLYLVGEIRGQLHSLLL